MATKIFKIEHFDDNNGINKIFGNCVFATRESARRYLRDKICDWIDYEYRKYCRCNDKQINEKYIQDVIYSIKDGKNYNEDKFILSEDMCYIEFYQEKYHSYNPHRFLINYVYMKNY